MNQKYLFLSGIIVIFCFLFSYNGYAQGTNTVVGPGYTFNKVYDHYGNQYDLSEIVVSQVKTPSVLCTNSSGYFDLYFDTGSGFEQNTPIQIARRDVLCQLFKDISDFIIPVDPTQKVKIWIRDITYYASSPATSDVLGIASSFYTMPAAATGVGGIVDGQIWRTINTGEDAHINSTSPLYSNNSVGMFYHGVVAFNFTNPTFAWHTDLTTLPSAGYNDLYTVALHEVMHSLGIMSLIRADGASKFITQGLNYYSRYDTFLKTGAGQSIITNTSSCSLYNYTFNSALNTSVLAPNPNSIACATMTFDCNTAIKFAGSVNQAVYTPQCFANTSSLSHFEDRCHQPIAYSNPGDYYVMGFANGTGPTSAKRYIKPEERIALCDLGYKVNNVFGNSLNSNNLFAYTGSICPGIGVAGVNDSSPLWVVIYNGSLNISGSQILINDVNAASFECLEDVYGMGSVNIASGGMASTIVYTPNGTGGMTLLRYIPVDANGNKGNITYVFIEITDNCEIEACNMLSNGDFENGTGCGDSNIGFGNMHVNCWDRLTSFSYNSRGCVTPLQGALFSVPNSTYMCNPPTESWSGIAGNNNKFVSFDYFGESIQTTLNSPIQSGGSYMLSLWIKIAPNTNWYNQSGVASGKIVFRGNPAPYVLPVFPSVWASGLCGEYLTEVVVPNDGSWHHVNLQFTYTGSMALNSLLIGNSSSPGCRILIDDVILTYGGFLPPTPICFPSLLTNLSTYANPPGGTFSGTGVSFNGVDYSFNPTLEGVYSVVYTYTNASGCEIDVPANIAVIRPDTPTLTVTASSNTMCLDNPVTLTVTGASNYTWSPAGNCIAPCNVVSVNPTVTTNYTVFGNYGLGCGTSTATIVVSVTGPSLCCSSPNTVIANNTNSSSHTATLSNLIIDVLGTYNINTNMTYSNVVFRMAPGSKFVVNSINSMTLNNCKLFSCSNMWDGIYLLQSGASAAGIRVFAGTSIEDAINGIVANSNNTSIGSNIQIASTTFNKNYKSIQILNYTGSPDYPFSIMRSTINCTNSAYSLGVTLKAPYSGLRSNVGIVVNKVNKIRIGSSVNLSHSNNFNNLEYGIYSTDASATIVNNSFTNISGSFPLCFVLPGQPSPFCPPLGIAIFQPNVSQMSNTLTVGGSGLYEPNSFIDVMRAIDATNLKVVNVVKNTFTCSITSPVFSSSSGSGLVGEYGIITSNISNNLTITNNYVANFANAVLHNRNSLSATSYNPLVSIQTNSIIANSASGYVATGIFMYDVSINTIGGTSNVFIRNNILTGIRNYGIRLNYIKNRPVISGTSLFAQIINMAYSASSSNWGIYLQACDKALVTNNKIISGGNSNLNANGIYLERSINSYVQCNYIYNTGCAITIHGDCTGPYTSSSAYGSGIVANTFTATGCGIRLRSSGKVGQQGDATHPSSNVWLGTSGSYNAGQTRTEGSSSSPANSIFYCNNGVSAQWPINHQTLTGIVYVNGTTILPATGTSPLCPGPSALEQLPDPGEAESEGVAGRNMSINRVNLGNEQLTGSEFRLYPNPSNGLFYIEASQPLTHILVRVIDVAGRVILKVQFDNFHKEVIDLSDGDKGVYTLEIVDGSNSNYYKLIKD